MYQTVRVQYDHGPMISVQDGFQSVDIMLFRNRENLKVFQLLSLAQAGFPRLLSESI